MLNKIIDLAIANRLMVVLALIATMLGGMLVLLEAGGHVVDRQGRDLVTLDWSARRSPVAGSSAAILEMLLD